MPGTKGVNSTKSLSNLESNLSKLKKGLNIKIMTSKNKVTLFIIYFKNE